MERNDIMALEIKEYVGKGNIKTNNENTGKQKKAKPAPKKAPKKK